jgi:hypothetical protein
MGKGRNKKRHAEPDANPLHGLSASVILERGGACVRIDEVPADQAFNVLAELLGAMRMVAKVAPELTVELTPIAGYSPLEVTDDGDEQCRRIGFRA